VRIDVADPGSERLTVVAALVDAGFDVSTRELRDVVETRADLLVLAADAPDALVMLRRLRDDGRRPDVPVVLLGTPDTAAPIPEGPGFGAELVLARPVDERRLVDGVKRLLRERRSDRAPASHAPEQTMHLDADLGERDDPSGVSAIRPLDDESERDERRSAAPPRASQPPPTGVSQIERRSEVPVSVVTTGSGSSQVSSTADMGAQAPISDALRALLSAADRRVFPGLAAIDVSIPAGEASARELVPDDLFDDASPDVEGEDEGLFVVAPLAAVLGASVSSAPPRLRPPSEPPAERDKKTSPGTPLSLGQGFKIPNPLPPRNEGPPLATLTEDEALGPLDASGSRRLPLVPGAMLRALASIVLGRSSLRARVVSAGLEADLTFTRGELAKIEGPVAMLAIARIGRTANDEATARARLAMLVQRGELTAAGEALALSRAERDLFVQVACLGGGEASFQAARDDDAPARLGSTGRALAMAASDARAAHAVDAILAPLGALGRLDTTRALGGAAAALGIAPDLARFFDGEGDGTTRVALARAARIAPELPAMAALLVASGALTLASGRAAEVADAAAVELTVREHALRADDADYFAILGVADAASDAEVETASAGRRTMLRMLSLDELGLGRLAELRDRGIAAIDEAHEVLADPQRRAAYARAIGRASAKGPGAAPPAAV
jgi:hypothetical protein